MPEGLSIREFARRDGCNEKLVRRKLQSGHLTAFEDGSIDPKLVGTDWRARVRTSAADTAVGADSPRAPVRTRAERVRMDEEDDGDDPESIGEIAERILQDALGDGRPILTKAQAEQLKENYIALLRQLQYDRESGAVAEIEDITTAVAAEYQLVKNRLFNIGARVAPRCAMLKSAEEIKALIDGEVTLALKELTLDQGGRGERAADT